MPVHQNYIRSSYFMLLSAGLGVMNIIFAPEIFSSAKAIAEGYFTLLFLVGLALLIRKGLKWVKYLQLVIMVIGLLGIPFIIQNLAKNPFVGVINVIQTVFQFWSLILLFKTPDEKAN